MKHLIEVPDGTALQSKPFREWVPITDRLPEYAGVYLCTIQSGEHYSVTMCTWRPTLYAWMPLMYGNHDNVIAWRPLPEPYRKEGNDDGL